MLNHDEVINYYTNLKKQASNIKNATERRDYVIKELGRYSLLEWYEIGNILRSANLM